MFERKNLVVFALKFIISFGILAFLLIYKTSVKDIVSTLKDVNLFWLAISFSLHFVGLLISAYRWQILAFAQGDRVPLGFLFKSYLVGTFFNIFLPSRFGGDVVRIWDGSRYSRSLVKSSAIVVVERLTGIIVLFIFALLASLIRLDMAEKIPVIWVSLLLGLTVLGLLVFFFLPVVGRGLEKFPAKGFLDKVKQKIISFRKAVLLYREKPREFFKAVLWAFLLQLNVIIYYFLIGKALQLNIQFLDYFIFIPIVVLIQIIPVTINGLGLREGSYIEIFKFYGISPQTAFSFSLVEVAFSFIIGGSGGIIYILRK